MKDYSKKGTLQLNDLLNLFEDNLTASNITASNLLGQISASIVKKRIELGMTQNEFASYMDVSQGMVSRWEGGDYNFSIKTLADVAEKLELELDVSLCPCSSAVQVRRMLDTDVLYVMSEQKEFVGKPCQVIDYKSSAKMAQDINRCKVYNFYERIEM